ncbi:MAG: aminodeoxychorismate/anthranilate synthase component II [Candidatus Zixiibacteriota bacterium]|nr:MAG: aminodeoxychorismate/anthranilate synthase component II [candidate division Zixibacteria bacterium]
MILLLDNYDSFTYNLYQYLAELGADLEVIRNDVITVDDIIRMELQAIVLSPGPGRPENAGIMPNLIRRMADRVPILGVCLGHQAIAQSYGGRITYALTLMHGKTSEIKHSGTCLFQDIPSPFIATRYHSLVVDPESLPSQIKVTAQTSDGVIMGLQHRKLPLYGLQFHPESIMTPYGKNILNNFLKTLN